MSRTNIVRTNPQETFLCVHCGRAVSPLDQGGEHRNHCPHCLTSLHVDITVGDRRSSCRGEMVPISLWIGKKGEGALIHRCRRCGVVRTNRIAGDDNEAELFLLAASLMSRLPFPTERALDQLGGGKIKEAAHG